MTLILDAPDVGDIEKQFICDAIDHQYVSTFGPYISSFERAFSVLIGSPRSVAVQSGTAALHMALYEAGIGPGDEVIVPALTFSASVNPILYVGATPVLVDVDLESWVVTVDHIESAITSKTKAIIVVHLYGVMANMPDIMGCANKHNLIVIEDATESLCSSFNGQASGTFGHFGAFSFNGNKMMTTGGGGVITAKDNQALTHIHFLINQARDDSKGDYHPEMGFNYRMTNLEASLGLAQLQRLNDFISKKRKFHAIYKQAFESHPNIHLQSSVDSFPNYWFNAALFETSNIEGIQQQLKNKGIPTRRIFQPLSMFPYLPKPSAPLTQSESIFNRGLCLPSSTLNDVNDIKRAASTIIDTMLQQ